MWRFEGGRPGDRAQHPQRRKGNKGSMTGEQAAAERVDSTTFDRKAKICPCRVWQVTVRNLDFILSVEWSHWRDFSQRMMWPDLWAFCHSSPIACTYCKSKVLREKSAPRQSCLGTNCIKPYRQFSPGRTGRLFPSSHILTRQALWRMFSLYSNCQRTPGKCALDVVVKQWVYWMTCWVLLKNNSQKRQVTSLCEWR